MSLHLSKNIMQSNKKDKWVSHTLLPFYFTSISPSLFPFYYFPTPSSHPSREVATPCGQPCPPCARLYLGLLSPSQFFLLFYPNSFIHSSTKRSHQSLPSETMARTYPLSLPYNQCLGAKEDPYSFSIVYLERLKEW